MDTGPHLPGLGQGLSSYLAFSARATEPSVLPGLMAFFSVSGLRAHLATVVLTLETTFPWGQQNPHPFKSTSGILLIIQPLFACLFSRLLQSKSNQLLQTPWLFSLSSSLRHALLHPFPASMLGGFRAAPGNGSLNHTPTAELS